MPTVAFQGGVDIFFVISGFIMMYTTIRHPMSGATFLQKRFIRIVPLYWSMTVIVAVAASLVPRFFHDTVFTWPEFVSALIFWPFRNPAGAGDIAPLIKLGWTLNYEMFFYFVFAAVILLPPLRRLAAVALVFFSLVTLGWLFHPNSVQLQFWSNPIVLEFVGGCTLGILEARGILKRLYPGYAVVLLVASSVAFFYFGVAEAAGFQRIFVRGLPALGVTLSVLSLDREHALRIPARLTALLLLLGDASYSIYLSHLYAVRGFSNFWEKVHLPMTSPFDAAAYVLLCVFFGCVVGLLTWRFLEVPATDWTRQILARRRLASA
jgi:exopolysaccharide production protein ExoZ